MADLLPAVPWWFWSAVLIVLGIGYFVERLVGELRAIRRQLEALTEQLAEAEAGREAERAHARTRFSERSVTAERA